MGNRNKISFEHDLWCGEKALKEAFPNLFGIACTKDAPIVTHLKLYDGSN